MRFTWPAFWCALGLFVLFAAGWRFWPYPKHPGGFTITVLAWIYTTYLCVDPAWINPLPQRLRENWYPFLGMWIFWFYCMTYGLRDALPLSVLMWGLWYTWEVRNANYEARRRREQMESAELLVRRVLAALRTHGIDLPEDQIFRAYISETQREEPASTPRVTQEQPGEPGADDRPPGTESA